jgi:hypothetical protein
MFEGVLSRVKLIFCLPIVVAILFFVASPISSYAAETRGLRVAAKDSASGEKKEVKIYNKSFAVIIGIDQYPNMKFDEQLAYAVRDAKGVEQVLRRNFKFDKIITLYNKEATKDNILKVLLGDLTREVTDQDAVFVFWASHGYTEKTSFGDLGYLVPYDGTSNTSELYKNISMTTLKDDISKKIPAKHVFYVMDACYSGLLATTRGTTHQSARDYAYLQEITKEKVRQVLTAGDKGQEVLDGGPKGHSVFTGRFIEYLENADDFVTATEISTMLREKVFSDAKSRNHTQTPRYGELFGVGDFVFVPSLEQKVEDTQAMVAGLQKELEKLKATEIAAAKAQDERARRQVEIEKRAIEAKLKAEQLRQQGLEEERRKQEAEDTARKQRENQLALQIKTDHARLASLKKQVEEKRTILGGTAISSLSPHATLTDMTDIDAKVKEIRESFRKELASSINQISVRLNDRFEKLVGAKKDEFESDQEFRSRIARQRAELEIEQTREFAALEERVRKEYDQAITPFVRNLKGLTINEFILTAENLRLELGTYHAASDTYPVTIRTKQPLQGVMVAATANIPMPRSEAREFKQHFDNDLLRPEIRGSFETKEVFKIAQARVVDDATGKQYDLFSSKFVDLGNGTVYDSETKLLWAKKTDYLPAPIDKWLRLQDIKPRVDVLSIAELSGWRLPNHDELKRMLKVYQNLEPHPFVNVHKSYRISDPEKDYGHFRMDYEWKGNHRWTGVGGENQIFVWPVRGSGEQKKR